MKQKIYYWILCFSVLFTPACFKTKGWVDYGKERREFMMNFNRATHASLKIEEFYSEEDKIYDKAINSTMEEAQLQLDVIKELIIEPKYNQYAQKLNEAYNLQLRDLNKLQKIKESYDSLKYNTEFNFSDGYIDEDGVQARVLELSVLRDSLFNEASEYEKLWYQRLGKVKTDDSEE